MFTNKLPKPEDPATVEIPDYPLKGIPDLDLADPVRMQGIVPDDEACTRLWDKYEMLDNIRAHSKVVANVATRLAKRAKSLGLCVNVEAVRASALFHDLAKTHCLCHGGSHAELGASWVVQETGNYELARGVFHHVYWPWKLPADDAARMCSLPFFILYADKRAKHDSFVTLESRFEDLIDRYGKTEEHRKSIRASYLQAKAIEDALSKHLGVGLAHTIPA